MLSCGPLANEKLSVLTSADVQVNIPEALTKLSFASLWMSICNLLSAAQHPLKFMRPE